MKSSMNRFLCLSIGLALAVGCGSGYGSQSGLVGPAGGIVEVQGGATVVVPPGALAHEVTIVVEEGGSPTNVDYVASSLWHFGPDGQAFIKPVVVTIPVTSGTGRNDLAVFWSRPGSSDEYEVVYPAAFSENRDSVTVQINHFSSGFVGTGNANACSTRYKNTGASVEDAWTGLSWFRQDVFLGPTYLEAVNACAESTVDGYTDWRLPTVQEFMEYVRGCGEHNKFGTYWCCLPHEFDECRDKHEWWTSTPGDATDERLLVTFSECPWSTYSHVVGNEFSIISAGSDFTCVRGESSVCIPDCSGLECGPDPVCGVPCGTCGTGYSCQDGECIKGVCVPDCTGLECGPDPVCGQSCGTCDTGYFCQDGECIEDACVPDCTRLECGPDPICGQSCGTCDNGYSCQDGECNCEPDCTGRDCGVDPFCGTLDCGACGAGLDCDDTGHCVPNGSTYSDESVRLMWQVSPTQNLAWGGSGETSCSLLKLEGYDDWRLPTFDELRSLIRGCDVCSDYVPVVHSQCEGCEDMKGPSDGWYWPSQFRPHDGDPRCNETKRATYWSSTLIGTSTSYYNYGFVDFSTGGLGSWTDECAGGCESSCLMAIRCVRSL